MAIPSPGGFPGGVWVNPQPDKVAESAGRLYYSGKTQKGRGVGSRVRKLNGTCWYLVYPGERITLAGATA
jgi:hypothetical protein